MLTKEKINMISKDAYFSVLKDGRPIRLSVWGASMYPFLKNGDKLKILPISKEGIRIGDIISVDRKNDSGAWVIIHRVVKISKDNMGRIIYFTKGDSQTGGLEGPITREDIKGKVGGIYRRGLEINLESGWWPTFNVFIARISLLFPRLLIFFSRYLNLFIEQKLFLSKIRNKLKKGDVIRYNTEELLLIFARKDPDAALIKKSEELIEDGIDWKLFLASAIESGMSILVFNNLGKPCGVYMPQEIFDQLRAAYIYILPKAARQDVESRKILKLLTENGISAVAVKGTFLSKRIYGDIETRGLSVDIDILIKWEQREKTHGVLIENGFRSVPSDMSADRLWQETYLNPQPAGIIDVQYDIWLRGYNKEAITGLWDGARRVIEAGAVYYYELRDEEQLIYLAKSLVTLDESRKYLKCACDINEFLNRYSDGLNWNEVINKAKKWRLGVSLYTSLYLTQLLFGNRIPGWVINKLKPGFFKRRFIRFFFNRKTVFRENAARRFMDAFMSIVFFEILEARSLREYAVVFNRVFFPPKEVLGDRTYISRIFSGLLKLFRSVLFSG